MRAGAQPAPSTPRLRRGGVPYSQSGRRFSISPETKTQRYRDIWTEPLFIDESTARILDLSDGTRTAAEIITQLEHEQAGAKGNELEWIEYLFVEGLIGLRQRSPTYVSANAESEQICEQYG